jgi:hypothetical protein
MDRDINFYNEESFHYEDKYSIRFAEYYLSYWYNSSYESEFLEFEKEFLDIEIADFKKIKRLLYDIIKGDKDFNSFGPAFLLRNPDIEQLEPNDLERMLTRSEEKLDFLEKKRKDILKKTKRIYISAGNSDPKIEILKKDIRKHHENILKRAIDIITDIDEFFQTECSFEEFKELTFEEMLKRVYLFEHKRTPKFTMPNPDHDKIKKILEPLRQAFHDPKHIDKIIEALTNWLMNNRLLVGLPSKSLIKGFTPEDFYTPFAKLEKETPLIRDQIAQVIHDTVLSKKKNSSGYYAKLKITTIHQRLKEYQNK